MPWSGADVRSDDSSVLSVPGPQDHPGNPARLTPSYYLLSGENPGSGAVCNHSSTTFLHRVISGVVEGVVEVTGRWVRAPFDASPAAPVRPRRERSALPGNGPVADDDRTPVRPATALYHGISSNRHAYAC